MRILFTTAEVQPFSKTGGLADVAGALPRALAARGHEVLVVSPWYRALAAAPLWIGDVEAPFSGGFEPVGVGTLERDGVRYAFVGHEAFRRDRLYGYPDDARRFALLTRAVPQVAARVGFRPDVAHANDWHTGYLPVVLQRGWHLPDGFPGLPSVFTVHNVQHQGEAGLADALHWLRLPGELRSSWIERSGRANALLAGLGFATRVTTVSPTYALEVQRPEFGFGLDGSFRAVTGKLEGILNGIDTAEWDPRTDGRLPVRYAASGAPREVTAGSAAKVELARRHGLDPERPLLAAVTRLAEQKGIDLLLDGAPDLLGQGWALFVLGSGDRALEERLARLAARERQVGAVIGFDEDLARLCYAAADAFAIPSRFEPCGLTQMIAMRYGALPVARATGGLVDTIDHGRTGFLFEHPDPAGLAWAAGQARSLYGTPAWRRMVDEAMRQDFSWDASAARYEGVYAAVVGDWEWE